MKRTAYLAMVLGLLVLFAGCKKQESDADAIRSGINQHLASLNTLNLGAMDMNITKVSVQGNQAEAQVEFKPKTGASQASGMQVAYSLEKRNGIWVVEDTKAAGGAIQHPGPGGNVPTGAAPSSPDGSMPNFRDLVPNSGSGTLPAGHPPVNPQGNPPAR